MNALLVTEVEKVLALVRPYIQADGGDIELVSVEDEGTVRVRLTGACHGCASAHVTLFEGVQAALQGQLAWVRRVEPVEDGEIHAPRTTDRPSQWFEQSYGALLGLAQTASQALELDGLSAVEIVNLMSAIKRDLELVLSLEDQCLHGAVESLLGGGPAAILRREQPRLRELASSLLDAAESEADILRPRLLGFARTLEQHYQKERGAIWPLVDESLPADVRRELLDDIRRRIGKASTTQTPGDYHAANHH